MKSIVLCADDYGQNNAISQAIIELFQKNSLSATSCMVNSYYWQAHAKLLAPFKDKVALGLHFNLTEGKPVTKTAGFEFIPLPQLIFKAMIRKLDKAAIETELLAQLDRFVAEVGREPDFIDGHQHVHQLPIVRDALFSVYDMRLKKSNCYIRCVNDPNALRKVSFNNTYVKTLLIQLCGSFGFKKELVKRNIPHNTSFRGIYDFTEAKKYPDIFPNFLADIGERGVIMCHPGLSASADQDVIAESRFQEYQYFMSDKFTQDCAAQQVTLGRFNENK